LFTPAKKRFGQNFLTDPHKAEGLVAALELVPGDSVLEVGPGTGILTELIMKSGANLTAVELDRDLMEPLRERFGKSDKFKLIESDIIKLNLGDIAASSKFKIIGNLPYNISGAIVEWLIEYNDVIIFAVITVQKEVAARLKAEPDCRDYGSLSVIVQSYFDIKRLFDIPPGCFTPKPKVDSTVLMLTPNKKIDIDFIPFRDFLRAAFSQKRKKLANSLNSRALPDGRTLTREEIEKYLVRLGKMADIRAEQLTLSDFLELYRMTRE